MINKLFWKITARILARPAITDWLIKRAMKTPYSHILSMDGKEVYMFRYWLFNPYPIGSMGKRKRWQLPVSMRLHKIMRRDYDRHQHDHPWNARTIILRNSYTEYRGDEKFTRVAGETATLRYNEYHRIDWVDPEGVWTLFITYKYRGVWGFLVDGKKVPFREYLKEE